MPAMDFPISPTIGQQYTNDYGIAYTWDGVAWLIGAFAIGNFTTLSDMVNQIRVLLQDTDTAAAYRYSTPSIVANINMGVIEMFRIRPDIFLHLHYEIPSFTASNLNVDWPFELQWVPPIVYYAVGLTQLRDDEGTQDQRAAAFMQKFNAILVTPVS